MKKMTELNITDKRVLIRSDLNVPMKNNIIQSDARLIAAMPTIQLAASKQAKVIVMSHLGRPKEGHFSKKYSLFPIFEYFKKHMKNTKIYFSNNYFDKCIVKNGEVLILENVRFNLGELKNDNLLSQKYSNLCDIFVMDAFGSAHRMQASTYGVGMFSKTVCAGPLLIREINALKTVLKNPKRPVTAIIGGSKVSTKFNVLNKLSQIADTVIVGGGIANTFLAIDHNIGKSLYEPNFISKAKKLKNKYNIIIPIDSRVGKKFCKTEKSIIRLPEEIKQDEEIMDFGDQTIKKVVNILKTSQTIIWNGPVGVFEFPNFCVGTKIIAKTIAENTGFSVAGGGDTLSVIDMFNIKKNISYISTGGGAFLEFLEGKILPAIHLLQERYKQ
ncbi:MAG: phosphoglycerate kinase [Buchnera aphidicola (Pentalonia nigronervosa)]|uniref:Phosphoglycerate kinase n=1 Tax=Buchnera aphidicola (Pentalonia nigronervosa) TaxID=1309793 RepID=A0A7H1AYT8_9GAMM|nr:MAG: phosphoglycerate kinase [Buchnera aphidicola (Pentalonia nigronervosa)]